MPVQWRARPKGPGEAPRIERTLAARPRRLHLLS
jgi:hypothetical protein